MLYFKDILPSFFFFFLILSPILLCAWAVEEAGRRRNVCANDCLMHSCRLKTSYLVEYHVLQEDEKFIFTAQFLP